MLRIISLFLLLIISQFSFAETIPAPSFKYKYSVSGYSDVVGYQESALTAINAFVSHVTGTSLYDSCSLIEVTGGYTARCVKSQNNSNGAYFTSSFSFAACPSSYYVSDGNGNKNDYGKYCTKNSCQDLFQTSTLMEIPPGQTVTNACYDGCSASLYEGGSWSCESDSVACWIRVKYDGNSCSGGVDYAANASSSSSGSDSDSPPPPCSGGSTTGTVNGESVTTCADDGTDSPPITDTSSSSTPPTTTSGAGTTVGDVGNTSGSQTGTQTGDFGNTSSTGGGGGDSGSTSGGDSGSTSGGDSGSTSGGDSGSTSGGDSGSTSGGDSGSTSGGDSGSTSGGDSGSTSGGDSGSTSGGDSGSASGGASGSGGGSDSGTGAATSGAGGTDSDTPAEEEEESGDGGGSFSAPGKGTDYLKDVFGESDLADLASDNAELTTKINQKMADVKSVFNLGVLSVSGDMPDNQQQIKGASVDLSGRNIFEQFSIVAAAFYLCAVATAIYIAMGGKK